MALTKADCEKIIYTALSHSKTVFCVMQNRYSPPSVWLKEMIQPKTIGDIYMVQLNCYWNRDDRYYKAGGWKGTQDLDGGTLFTQFSHWIDIMYWIFGDIKNIQAKFLRELEEVSKFKEMMSTFTVTAQLFEQSNCFSAKNN
jgi:predicted dehydrogenase